MALNLTKNYIVIVAIELKDKKRRTGMIVMDSTDTLESQNVQMNSLRVELGIGYYINTVQLEFNTD